MIERINQFAARRFGGVGTTRGSFLRIHAWVLVFLVVVSSLAPVHDLKRRAVAALGPVHVLRRDLSDQRAWAPSPFGKRVFHIAWIFGSEGDVTRVETPFPPTLGEFLVKSLPAIGKKNVVVDTYDLSSMKLGDLYMTLLDALAAKPDLVMLSLNPVWVMDPFAVHRWPQFDARTALELLKRPAQWPIGAALLSPSDLLWGVAQSTLAPISERVYWSGRVHTLVDNIGTLDRSQLALRTSARRPDESEVVLGQQAITFWSAFRLHLISRAQFGTLNENPKGPEQWARWINVTSNKAGNQMNALLLRAIASELRSAGIPSLVYLAQANRAWIRTNKPFAGAVDGVERQLAKFSGTFRARNILFQPQALSRFVPDLVYRDETHIASVGSLGPYFAAQVCRVLTQVGRGNGCRPVVEGSKP